MSESDTDFASPSSVPQPKAGSTVTELVVPGVCSWTRLIWYCCVINMYSFLVMRAERGRKERGSTGDRREKGSRKGKEGGGRETREDRG